MTFDADIIIVGGGLNGPVMALAAASAGLSSVILDAMPGSARANPEFDGRSYAIALSSQRMLSALGLWAELSRHAQPILDIVVSDGEPGRGAGPSHLHFDHREIEEGPFGAIVEDRYVRAALMAAASNHPMIDVRNTQRVVAQRPEQAGVAVVLDTGQEITGQLLIGCDGRNSGTAHRAALRSTGWSYDQVSLVCALEHDRPHQGIAHQMFFAEGPLAILPLVGGNRSSIVWTESRARAEHIMAMDDAAYMTVLAPRFGDFLGQITLTGARYAYPLSLSLVPQFVADRVALVGDAAHGVHPIAGQGLNLGFRDAAALTEVLAEAKRRGEDIGLTPVLQRYAQWRRTDTTLLAAATDGINRIFSNDNPVLRAARDIGLGLVNATPFARRALMREAAGLSGDLPRLLQGLSV